MSSISAIMCAPKYHHLMNVESEIMRLWKHLPRDAHKSRKTWSIKQSMSRQAIFCTWHTGCFLWQYTQALVSPNSFLSFTVFPCACSFLTVHHHEGSIWDALLLLRQQNNRELSFFLSLSLCLPLLFQHQRFTGKKSSSVSLTTVTIAFWVSCQSSRLKVQSES